MLMPSGPVVVFAVPDGTDISDVVNKCSFR